MKDIVERLRDAENYDAKVGRYEAADEIERLRAELKSLQRADNELCDLICDWADTDELLLAIDALRRATSR